MTKLAVEDGPGRSERREACRWCRRPVEHPKVGRPREFCRRSCRQRDFEARQRATRHGLDESAIIVARSELDDLRDELYVLTCAIEDIERDLSGRPDIDDYRDAVNTLLAAARPLTAGAGHLTTSGRERP